MPPPPGVSRWSRLRPADGTDAACLVLVVLGLLLTLLYGSGFDGAEFGVVGFVLGPVMALHGSSPLFSFLGLAFYLSRRGRVLGANRRWLWAGFVVTAPLWFLLGQPVVVKGLGDRQILAWVWNLVAAGMMGFGVWRTLRRRGARR